MNSPLDLAVMALGLEEVNKIKNKKTIHFFKKKV